MASGTRPTKQEQLPASDEITEVAPGVLRLQLPISLPGLGHVNCYALEDERGVAVVDPGLPGPSAWDDLVGRITAAGFPLERVHSVVVTHSHPDHYGGANQLQEVSGADIVTHATFRNWWDPDTDDDTELDDAGELPDEVGPDDPVLLQAQDNDPTLVIDPDRPNRAKILAEAAPWGPNRQRSAKTIKQMRSRMMHSMLRTPTPTVRLDEAQTIRLGRRDWVAIHTPGHTPDHLCLFDPTNGVMLSGDHVLPTITPHISGVGAGDDPLKGFFRSLERMKEFEGVTTVLPAHGHPFSDLNGRVDAIADHHETRLATLRKAAAALGPSTVPTLSHELFPERSWGPMAESETFAHLEHLRLAGELVRDDSGASVTYRMA